MLLSSGTPGCNQGVTILKLSASFALPQTSGWLLQSVYYLVSIAVDDDLADFVQVWWISRLFVFEGFLKFKSFVTKRQIH